MSMRKKKQQIKKASEITEEELSKCFDALREIAIARAEEKRNEPNGEGRLALVRDVASHARIEGIEKLMRVCVEVAKGTPYQQALAMADIDHITFSLKRRQNMAIGMIFSASQEVRDGQMQQKCLSAFSKLLEGDQPNVKAVLAGLEHLSSDGKWKKNQSSSGSGGGASTVYNIQLIHAPRADRVAIADAKCENRARIAEALEIIEVKGE